MTIAWLSRHWFILGLLAAGGLAFLLPDVGARGGPLAPELTIRAGVALIFFMQGLAISTAALRAGALRWRLHLMVQLFVFVAFPLGVILLDRAAGGLLPDDLRLGFLFLAVLPTTISTCVVFTATAGGNVSGALFNSAFANIAAVGITPLWAALLMGARGESPAVLPMVGEIALLLLAPLVAGQAVRPLLHRRWQPKRALLSVLSNTIILFMVFAAFANSVQTGAFAATGAAATLIVMAAAAMLFVIATTVAAFLGKRLGFDPADRRALLFCAPQKTLAAGAPMGQILFAGHPGLGLILLPLMVYHIVQLLAGASLAERLGRATAAASAAAPESAPFPQ